MALPQLLSSERANYEISVMFLVCITISCEEINFLNIFSYQLNLTYVMTWLVLNYNQKSYKIYDLPNMFWNS